MSCHAAAERTDNNRSCILCETCIFGLQITISYVSKHREGSCRIAYEVAQYNWLLHAETEAWYAVIHCNVQYAAIELTNSITLC